MTDEFPDPNGPLVTAARYNDAQAEELGLHDTTAQLGIDLEESMHVAEQRAMRAVLVQNNRMAEFKRLYDTNDATTIAFSAAESRQIAFYQAAYLDGIAIGWKARELEDRNG